MKLGKKFEKGMWKHKGKLFLILVLILLAFVSKSVNELGVNFIEDQKEREAGILIGAEPFIIDVGNEIGVLMIHGYSSSPKDFRELGVYLAERGVSVHAPLLPGHGTHPRDLKDIEYEEWQNHVSQSLEKLNAEKKFVLGYSMGGTLALDLAAKNELEGVVAINSAIFIKSRYLPFVPLIRLVETYTTKTPEEITQFLDEERVVYDVIPLVSVLELQALINEVNVHSVEEPIIIFQSENDDTILPESADYIFSTVSSEDKELIFLSNSTHLEIDKPEEAFELIYDFIQKH